MKFKKILFYLLVTAVIFFGQFFVNRNMVTGVPPEIATETISGFQVADYMSKGPGVIYFWSDWCGICETMKGTMDQIYNDYPGVSIALQSGDADAVRRYVQQENIAWPTVVDETGEIGSRYGVRGVPAVFILDSDGEIVFTSVGYNTETGLRLRLWLADLW